MFCHVPYKPTPPPLELLEHLRKKRKKKIRWFATPPEWHLAEFVVFFAEQEPTTNQLLPLDSTTSSEQFAVGPLPLANGKHVWLRHLTKPIPEDRKDYLLQVRGSIKGLSVDQQTHKLRSLGIVMHIQESTIVAVPFGLESIKTK